MSFKKHHKKSWSPGLIATGSFHLHANLVQSHATMLAQDHVGVPAKWNGRTWHIKALLQKRLCFSNLDWPRLHSLQKWLRQLLPVVWPSSNVISILRSPERHCIKQESCHILCSPLLLPLMQLHWSVLFWFNNSFSNIKRSKRHPSNGSRLSAMLPSPLWRLWRFSQPQCSKPQVQGAICAVYHREKFWP